MTSAVFRATRSWAGRGETVEGWRARRYGLFLQLCAVQPDEAILDVGVGAGGALARFNTTNPIVGIDIEPRSSEWTSRPNVTMQRGDATSLPFGDRFFPIAFSNSVIEHIPKHLQGQFASEIRRVADRYFVQTPNRWFPIEPHYQVPLFQFLPVRVQRFLNRHFTLGWREKGCWEAVNLLSAGDLRCLFPDAEIRRERMFGLTKSLMAVRRPQAAPDATALGSTQVIAPPNG